MAGTSSHRTMLREIFFFGHSLQPEIDNLVAQGLRAGGQHVAVHVVELRPVFAVHQVAAGLGNLKSWLTVNDAVNL